MAGPSSPAMSSTSNFVGSNQGSHSIKRVGGIKLVVQSKKKTKGKQKLQSAATASTRGLPKRPHQQDGDVDGSSASNLPRTQQEETLPFEEEIPCDTLLAIRSLERTSQCLTIPLFVGTIPCVLESQLHHRLRSQNGEDTVVTRELQQLTQSNRIRHLSSPNGSLQLEALMESRHYIRAVWDAHRHYEKADATATSAFVSFLNQTTKRRILKSDFEDAGVVDTLVQMQVLLPLDNAYTLWLPHWGLVLKALSKGQQKVIAQLKRSHYKELSKAQVERFHHTGLSGSFVLHTLVAHGLVELQERPSGTFVHLAKSK